MRALDLFAAEWFTPTGEKVTRFKLRGLTGREQAEFMPDLAGSMDEITLPGRTMIGILLAGLEDWEKFDGAPDFKKGDATMIDYMPVSLQAELVGQIIARSVPTEDTKKK